MPRSCTICNHPERKFIDASIANKEPYLRIATRFALNDKTVGTHAKNHVRPFMSSVERQAEAAVLARVMQYRDEVNLPLAEKSKFIENKLWGLYDAADKVIDRVAVVKAIQQQQAEQARLAGAYIKDAPNESDVAIVLKGYKMWLKEMPHATEGEKALWLSWFAEESGIELLELKRGLRVQEVTEMVN